MFEGTQWDNIQDMLSKGRHGGGAREAELHHLSKLTWPIVRDIRLRLSIGERSEDVARRYSISNGTVSNVKLFKVWKHDPEQIKPNDGQVA